MHARFRAAGGDCHRDHRQHPPHRRGAVPAAAEDARVAKLGGDEEAIAAADNANKQATAEYELLKIEIFERWALKTPTLP